ncbi:Hypothetical_protein [Hexamita inflata]|uniref:Hypothetical_protein n=1 Tax=Hexamita inflata TaxID=28002 RepID=A0AA86RB81_9EUKA|nr:Hypothetical protein HINF_LOCUS5653 [Hexamita inflata]CAI9969648.1 Hypothetical protein HINF_LOCUS57293 [Hexamita inflata]
MGETRVIGKCGSLLIYLTRLLESIFSGFLIFPPFINMCMGFTIPLLFLAIFFVMCGLFVFFGCWKFTCIQKCLGMYFGFLFHDAFRGIFEMILGFMMYVAWNTWYQILCSIGCIIGVITGFLLLIQKCVVG